MAKHASRAKADIKDGNTTWKSLRNDEKTTEKMAPTEEISTVSELDKLYLGPKTAYIEAKATQKTKQILSLWKNLYLQLQKEPF